MTRAPSSSPFGKLTEEIRVAIDESTRDGLNALAFASNKPMPEYIRDLLHLHVHGHAAVLRARMKPLE